MDAEKGNNNSSHLHCGTTIFGAENNEIKVFVVVQFTLHRSYGEYEHENALE